MSISGKLDRITWAQLTLAERMAMVSMTAGAQGHIEWSIQRALCYHKLARLTPGGLVLTRDGRFVIAARHGLPVVVGKDNPAGPLRSSNLG
ncbi:hypothetical protein DevBK_18925 [Devosia sp. BK]|uniref:hypothetical protein n=1 Tax=unclassified Devosia TaxID=196773 RepID=UPI000714B1DB|nr:MULTISPECIES: hypothetical protein [unclassified Devosia]KQN78395.1 hypothetical protein ASE94_15585 [Devosia sp. Leaf64]MDV3253416.1 hypothetical protein [Devosia sp. BK]